MDGLLEGPTGFDSSSSVWHQSGWKEVAALRRKLEDLKELRELVRQLGRGGGKGPLKKAPQQVAASRNPHGVVRSPLQPEETRGLTRSGARLYASCACVCVCADSPHQSGGAVTLSVAVPELDSPAWLHGGSPVWLPLCMHTPHLTHLTHLTRLLRLSSSRKAT